jgi:hypothetical protein
MRNRDSTDDPGACDVEHGYLIGGGARDEKPLPVRRGGKRGGGEIVC